MYKKHISLFKIGVINIYEYLGIYNEEWIMLHAVKIKASSKKEAISKFKNYLETNVVSLLDENKIYVIPLFAVETIE